MTKEETAAMAERVRELAAKRFQAMDKDDDGKVSKRSTRARLPSSTGSTPTRMGS